METQGISDSAFWFIVVLVLCLIGLIILTGVMSKRFGEHMDYKNRMKAWDTSHRRLLEEIKRKEKESNDDG